MILKYGISKKMTDKKGRLVTSSKTFDNTVSELSVENTALKEKNAALVKEIDYLNMVVEDRERAVEYKDQECKQYIARLRDVSMIIDLLEDDRKELSKNIEYRTNPTLRLAAWALKNRVVGDNYE